MRDIMTGRKNPSNSLFLLILLFSLSMLLAGIIALRWSAAQEMDAVAETQQIMIESVKPDVTPPARKSERVIQTLTETEPAAEALSEAEPGEAAQTVASVGSEAASTGPCTPARTGEAEQGNTSGAGEPVQTWTQQDMIDMADIMYWEACGISDEANIMGVGCVILNRVDAGWGTLQQVMHAPDQFADFGGAPRYNQCGIDLWALAERVLNGERVIGPQYLFYGGDGHLNHFRTSY